MLKQHDLQIEANAPIPTWFGIGGGARQLARPRSAEDVLRCIELDPALRVLGDGANLLVDDDGVEELVIAFTAAEMQDLRFEDVSTDAVRIHAMAGASLPKLILETVRRGLAGLEGLGGIPATIGGAVIMNAGGSFGQIADTVSRVHAYDRQGRSISLERSQIDFGYRHSGLTDLLITSVELLLPKGDPGELRSRLKEVMAYKKSTQPMAEQSAGCIFRNPTLSRDLDGIGLTGQRISAGLLLDRTGCKGMRTGNAEVSHGHANFFVTRPGATARDVIDLIRHAREKVQDAWNITLETEVVIWRRS